MALETSAIGKIRQPVSKQIVACHSAESIEASADQLQTAPVGGLETSVLENKNALPCRAEHGWIDVEPHDVEAVAGDHPAPTAPIDVRYSAKSHAV